MHTRLGNVDPVERKTYPLASGQAILIHFPNSSVSSISLQCLTPAFEERARLRAYRMFCDTFSRLYCGPR